MLFIQKLILPSMQKPVLFPKVLILSLSKNKQAIKQTEECKTEDRKKKKKKKRGWEGIWLVFPCLLIVFCQTSGRLSTKFIFLNTLPVFLDEEITFLPV